MFSSSCFESDTQLGLCFVWFFPALCFLQVEHCTYSFSYYISLCFLLFSPVLLRSIEHILMYLSELRDCCSKRNLFGLNTLIKLFTYTHYCKTFLFDLVHHYPSNGYTAFKLMSMIKQVRFVGEERAVDVMLNFSKVLNTVYPSVLVSTALIAGPA